MDKYKKLIIVSKYLFFTENNKLIKDNLKILDLFEEHDIRVVVLGRRSTNQKLKREVPKEYSELIKFTDRGSWRKARESINERKKRKHIIALIGVVDEDAHFSFQCKIPIFNPQKVLSERKEVENKVRKYGLPFNDYKEIIGCMEAYHIHQQNYFELDFGNGYKVISLNNANTINRPEKEKEIKEVFRKNLKEKTRSRSRQVLFILLFHLMNEVTTNELFQDVDFWGTFPSSKKDAHITSVGFIKEAVRNIVNGKPQNGPEILERHINSSTKHMKNKSQRSKTRCDEDFKTLRVNPKLIDKINGKKVCIIDDYITYGYSAESAKHLLFEAGVKEIIFISMGKFGREYVATNYKISGNVSENYNYEFKSEESIYSIYNEISLYNANNDAEIMGFADIIQ